MSPEFCRQCAGGASRWPEHTGRPPLEYETCGFFCRRIPGWGSGESSISRYRVVLSTICSAVTSSATRSDRLVEPRVVAVAAAGGSGDVGGAETPAPPVGDRTEFRLLAQDAGRFRALLFEL